MNAEPQTTWPGPFARLYTVDDRGITGRPEILPVPKSESMPPPTGTPVLVIVSGPFALPAAKAQAARIAANETRGALRVAVFQVTAESATVQKEVLSELQVAFDGVVVETSEWYGQVAACLARTVLWRAEHEQWIGCDWNDVRHMFESSPGSLMRFGAGRGAATGRAATATRDAVAQACRHGFDLRRARSICVGLRCATPKLYGNEIKEVLRQIGTAISRDTSITIAAGCDRALQDGVLEIDIFTFGDIDAAESAAHESAGACAAVSLAVSDDTAWAGDDASQDPLYALARSLVLQHGRASVSLVQRHLRIGYGRASRLLDAIVDDIRSVSDGNKTHTVAMVDGAR